MPENQSLFCFTIPVAGQSTLELLLLFLSSEAEAEPGGLGLSASFLEGILGVNRKENPRVEGMLELRLLGVRAGRYIKTCPCSGYGMAYTGMRTFCNIWSTGGVFYCETARGFVRVGEGGG